MKIRISESKIRQIVNEGMFKSSLNKTMAEQKWPNYSAYLLAEVLKLEWENTLTESNSEQKPSPEWIAETASAFGLSDEEIREATDIMNNDELEEGIGGFFKAIAKPYQNIWKTFTNITQNAANLTDPEAKKAAAVVDKVDDQLPDPKELSAQVQQANSPEDIQVLLKKLIALLSKADDAVDLDAIKPGLEDQADQSFDAVEKIAGQVVKDPSLAGGGGEEGGGEQTAAIYKGKGGKGLQSFLARGSKQAPKLQGKAMGAVLKHIEKQLKAQGVTVSESALDEVQGWMWYGLVEDMMQDHYGAKITIQEILDEAVNKKQATIAKRKEAEAAAGGGAEKEPQGLPGEEAAAEAPIEPVKPTVKNTAPEGAASIKVFRGKGGEGLQSALAKSRNKLGIDQQTVAVIIKAVEEWANVNQIKVENVSADVFDTIISEISTKYQARRLKETIQKLRNV